MKPHLELYRDRDRKWRWRLVGSNGRKLAGSEAYSSKYKAVQTMRRVAEGPFTVKCPDA